MYESDAVVSACLVGHQYIIYFHMHNLPCGQLLTLFTHQVLAGYSKLYFSSKKYKSSSLLSTK